MSFLSPFVKLIFLSVTSVGQTKPQSQKNLSDGAIKAARSHHKDNGSFSELESQTPLLSPVISKATSRKTLLMPCCYRVLQMCCDLNGERFGTLFSFVN